MSYVSRLARTIRELYRATGAMARGRAVSTIEAELDELETVFGLLVLGSFVGIPSPPMQVSLDLMPHMERELIRMLEEVDTATTPISRLFSTFDIG